MLSGYVYKAADTMRISTATVTDDPDLVFTMAANTYYKVEAQILCWADVGINFRFSFRATGISMCQSILDCTPTVEPLPNFNQRSVFGYSTTYVTGDYNLVMNGSSTLSNRGFIMFRGLILSTGGTPGTFAFRWAQGTFNAGSGVWVWAGSFMTWEIVS